jgi:hypothetical protein
MTLKSQLTSLSYPNERTSLGSRGKSGGRAKESGEDSELHGRQSSVIDGIVVM